MGTEVASKDIGTEFKFKLCCQLCQRRQQLRQKIILVRQTACWATDRCQKVAFGRNLAEYNHVHNVTVLHRTTRKCVAQHALRLYPF